MFQLREERCLSVKPQVYNVSIRCNVRGLICCITHHSHDDSEGRAPPTPGAVDDNVGCVGDERSVVCVELARHVRRTVVVRVTDR